MDDDLRALQRSYWVAGLVVFALLLFYCLFSENLITLANFFMEPLGFLPFETVLSENPLAIPFWISFAIAIGTFISSFFILIFGLIAARIHDRIVETKNIKRAKIERDKII